MNYRTSTPLPAPCLLPTMLVCNIVLILNFQVSESAAEMAVQVMEDLGVDSESGVSLKDILSQQPAELDNQLLIDVWTELFYAGAELVAGAMGIGSAAKREICTWQENGEKRSLMELAGQGMAK